MVNTVGPLLALSPDGIASAFGPDKNVNLGDTGIGETPTRELIVSNLFGEDWGDLTSLAIYKVTSSNSAFQIANFRDFNDVVIEAGDPETNALSLSLNITGPGSLIAPFETTLTFFTDQNLAFDTGIDTRTGSSFSCR